MMSIKLFIKLILFSLTLKIVKTSPITDQVCFSDCMNSCLVLEALPSSYCSSLCTTHCTRNRSSRSIDISKEEFDCMFNCDTNGYSHQECFEQCRRASSATNESGKSKKVYGIYCVGFGSEACYKKCRLVESKDIKTCVAICCPK